jgi:hypothetical protein
MTTEPFEAKVAAGAGVVLCPENDKQLDKYPVKA